MTTPSPEFLAFQQALTKVVKSGQERLDYLMALVEADDNYGICLSCGEETMGVEPDAEHYECPACGEFQVSGVEQILLKVIS